jgi:hypothetical protein
MNRSQSISRTIRRHTDLPTERDNNNKQTNDDDGCSRELFTSFMFAGENRKCFSRLSIPDMNGRILSDLSRGDDVLLFVDSHGDDVIRVFRVELLCSSTDVMNDTGARCGIDDRFVISQIEEIISTIERSITVNVIQLEILNEQMTREIEFDVN